MSASASPSTHAKAPSEMRAAVRIGITDTTRLRVGYNYFAQELTDPGQNRWWNFVPSTERYPADVEPRFFHRIAQTFGHHERENRIGVAVRNERLQAGAFGEAREPFVLGDPRARELHQRIDLARASKRR